jgi:hypothetical protein
MPSTEYKYIISSIKSCQVTGVFRTLDVSFDLNTDSVSYTNAEFKIEITARGCNIEKFGVKYRKSDSSDWLYQYNNRAGSISLTNLDDNTKYDIKPICVISNTEYEGQYYNFTTKELVPNISKTDDTSTSLSFKTINIEELNGYNYGIFFDNTEYYPDDNGLFTLSNLSCDKTYSINSFIYKNGKRYIYAIGSFQTINFETGDPLQVSPSAAMIKVLVGSKEESKYGKKYDDYKVEVRCITDSEEGDALPEGLTPIYTGNTYEYCTTFSCPQKQIYQYRLRVGTRGLRTNLYLYGDWKTVDPGNPSVQVVEPLFEDIKATVGNGMVSISCSNVPGEENVTSKGLEYKVYSSENFNILNLTDNKGVLSKSFSTLVPGVDYIGRFYNKVENRMYYSAEFTFNSEGTLSMNNGGNDSDNATQDENLKLSILYPDNGIIHQMVSYYKNIRFYVTTPNGWYINSVFLDGVEIKYSPNNLRSELDIETGPITKDSSISISFCKPNSDTGYEKQESANELKVYSYGNKIFIESDNAAAIAKSVLVYDVSGKLIFSGIPKEPIEVPTSGLYIVKATYASYKLYVYF